MGEAFLHGSQKALDRIPPRPATLVLLGPERVKTAFTQETGPVQIRSCSQCNWYSIEKLERFRSVINALFHLTRREMNLY